jgi:hypothetical protein
VQEAHEQVDAPDQPEEQEPPFTRAAFEEAMAGTVGQMQEQMKRALQEQQRGFQRQLMQMQRQQQPKKDVIPGDEEFENLGVKDLRKMLVKMREELRNEHLRNYRNLQRKLEQQEVQSKRAARAEEIYNYLENTTKSVVSKLPVIRDNLTNQEFLKKLIAAEIISNGNDPRKVNITKIANDFAKTLGGQPTQRPLAPGQRPPTSAAPATKPAQARKEPETLEEFYKMQEEVMEQLQQAYEQGMS